MSNAIQFPTIETTDELTSLLIESTAIARRIHALQIESKNTSTLPNRLFNKDYSIKRTLNDV